MLYDGHLFVSVCFGEECDADVLYWMCFTESCDIDMGFGFVESKKNLKKIKIKNIIPFQKKTPTFCMKTCKNVKKNVNIFKGKFLVVS